MDRFLLDLENLPKAKKEVIFQITSSYQDAGKIAFIKSLIFLGFATIKQSDIDLATANIGKSTINSKHKYRIVLTNTPIAKFLKTFANQTTRRSCVYAFLYAGITNYINSKESLKTSKDKALIESIEKRFFLCGLNDHIDNMITINVSQDTSKASSAEKQPNVVSLKNYELDNKINDSASNSSSRSQVLLSAKTEITQNEIIDVDQNALVPPADAQTHLGKPNGVISTTKGFESHGESQKSNAEIESGTSVSKVESTDQDAPAPPRLKPRIEVEGI